MNVTMNFIMSTTRAISANRDIWWQRWDCCNVNITCNPFQTWWNCSGDGYGI